MVGPNMIERKHRPLRWVRGVSVLVALASLPACRSCKDDDAHVAKDDPRAPRADGCDAVAQAQCEGEARFFPEYLVMQFGDDAGCRRYVSTSCRSIWSTAAVTPAFLTACAAKMKSVDGAARWRAELTGTESICDWPKGTVPAGGACAHGDDCASKLCDGSESGGCGTCATPRAEGDTCTKQDCAWGLVCSGEKCVRPTTDGSCATTPCAWGLTCVHNRCVPPAKLGEACALPAGDDGPPCDELLGLTCARDKGDGKWNPNLVVPMHCAAARFARPGEACGLVAGDAIFCRGDASCLFSPGKMQGTCTRRLALGAACDSTEGPHAECESPASCIAGKCAITKPADCPTKTE